MADETDPPRKLYGFKPPEYERVNEPPRTGDAAPADTRPDPGVQPAGDNRIHVADLIRAGAAPGPLLSNNSPGNRSNEVHEVLRKNYQRDAAAGLYHVEAGPDKKRRRRIRNYCLGLLFVDGPLGIYAFMIGPGAALPFVCAIGGIGMITAALTWHTFFLRTE